jgi:hypothetical protein
LTILLQKLIFGAPTPFSAFTQFAVVEEPGNSNFWLQIANEI